MNSETKRHIDAARQVLVGVVPNPTSQIEQITNALIYKFMDDMDQASIKAGGEPSFFIGELEPYAWTRIMDSRIGNQERMNLYSEALVKFSQAKQLPELFRGIFRSAFLPYRSPETLGLFLKEIDYFDYSHPEELGNAYEYLLSIMSSQGDAGQFRTPRHIIDFIVDVINPTKDDKVLDPACGTGGFLVSTYKHILEQHDGKDDPDKKEKPLTPDDRKKLMTNFEGYDIDPTMVRIAQVNMYLHQFKNPKIYQYDSLSQEERWGDKFDVILANPPFMSPKGGIKPHSKFSISSNRSEVLFVDYIINHLRPKGRAGIIVPEGIIFQSGNAYKQLRKSLVEDGLYAVVSLPSGVFAPYAGVKTSILLFNNELAKLSKEILFVKVENDGYDLGATKRPINKNDLPHALQELRAYEALVETGKATTTFTERIKRENAPDTLAIHHDKFILAKKSHIAESGDYSLSGDRYKPSKISEYTKWPIVTLGDVIELDFGQRITKSEKLGTKYPVYGGGGESFRTDSYNRQDEYVIARFAMSEQCVRYVSGQFWLMDSGGTFKIKRNFDGQVNKDYIGKILLARQEDVFRCARGGAQKNLNPDHFYEIKIPLPPLEIQEQIVKELDGYTAIINGAKQIATNWKPKIDIDPEWEKVKLPEISENHDSKRKPVTKSERSSGIYPYYGASGIVDYVDDYIFDGDYLLISEDGANLLARSTPIAFSISGKNWVNNHAHILKFKNMDTQKFVEVYINQIDISEFVTGMAQPKLNQQALNAIEIPLPKPDIQKQIVEKIEAERELVEAGKKLIRIYEEKTKSALEKLYGHDD
jgi:type I restriction enzyme M protein